MEKLSGWLNGDRLDKAASTSSMANTSGLMNSGYMKITGEATHSETWLTKFCSKHLQLCGVILLERSIMVAGLNFIQGVIL